MSHTCPGPGCATDVTDDMLACSRHWYQVPQRIRSKVWAAWNNGAGAGSAAHRKAITDAMTHMKPLPPRLGAR